MVTTMSSVKLVNSHLPHHLVTTHLPHLHYHPSHHFPVLRPEQTMTLDYSLPQRHSDADSDSPASPTESEDRHPLNLSETPTKKNKRKLSEPKKRADAVVKKLCAKTLNTDEKVSVGNEAQKPQKGKKLVNGNSKRVSPNSKSKSKLPRRSSSSTSSSGSSSDVDGAKDASASSSTSTSTPTIPSAVPSSIPPHFMHPLFPGLPPSALGYVPGLYFGAPPFHPGLHASFPALPLPLQHSYLAAAAAAAAAQTSSSTSSLTATTSSSSPSNPDSGDNPKSSTPQRSQPRSTQPTTVRPTAASTSTHQPSIHNASGSRSDDDDDDASSSRAQSPEDLTLGQKMSRKHRKNYKNMTRERRVEANARERTRVHTISAAFDALRRAVPSYSHNQKLSKLAILRIACSYIMSLARLADLDYTSASEHIGTPLTFAECVDMCTSTIQTEGRARRRH
ncbi:transcription factor ATOH8-like [Physella acuta]|uniref:transcription factor ATOH8-like n=1 Tax=Physella acuta TaxID=109671 RepID=UPI0027DB1BE9|nr:transcription factor ATOH8-like [Physella acuta]